MSISHRHHYIPQFYSRGFTDSNNMFFVYDKRNDRIWDKKVTPKSVFFEDGRNTVSTVSGSSSEIEDVFFKEVDNDSSKIISLFRDSKNSQSIHNGRNWGKLKIFILFLYWRIPSTDQIFEEYYPRMKTTFKDESGNLFDDPFFKQKLSEVMKKPIRSYLPIHIIFEILKDRKQGTITSQLNTKTQNFFLVGDYPVIFKDDPTNFETLFFNDFFIPISSQRVFFSFKTPGKSLTETDCHVLNSLIIDQSERYVCFPDKDWLERSVNLFKLYKNQRILPLLKNELFRIT